MRLALELLLQPVDRVVHRPVVQVVHHPEREEVLAARRLFRREVGLLECLARQARELDLDRAIAVQAAVFERILFVPRFLQILDAERVGVDDENAVRLQVAYVDLECSRVHCNEYVGLVTRRVDVFAAELDLESTDAGQRAGRGANLGREVGQRAQVVADGSCGCSKTIAGDLHPVAGIARKAHDDAIDAFDSLLVGGRLRGCLLCGHRLLDTHPLIERLCS